MQFIELMHARHATKRFDSTKKVPKETIEQILEIGRLSPSSMGLSPWHFVVIDEREMMQEIGDLAWGFKSHSDNASHIILIYARKGFATAPGSEYVRHFYKTIHGFDENMLEKRFQLMNSFQNKDFEMKDDEVRFQWNMHQCYIALANMMTGAMSFGVDSCPIEGFSKAAMRLFAKKYQYIDLEQYDLAVMCTFGYRAQEITPKRRWPLEAIVTHVKK